MVSTLLQPPHSVAGSNDLMVDDDISPPLSSPSLITGSKADERSGKTPQLHQPDTNEETARV